MIENVCAKVSLVMPAYNAERYIGEAVRSIQNQTLGDWELVIVDDCSTDNTFRIAEAMAAEDSRIHVHRLESNSGSAFMPRQRAVELSHSSVIAPLDADDMIEPGYLAMLLDEYFSRECDVVYPSMYWLDEESRPGERYVPIDDFDTTRAYSGRELIRYTLNGWEIGANGGVINRSLLLKCMAMVTDKTLMNADEFLTRVLLLHASKVGISPARYYYRKNNESITNMLSARHLDKLKVDIMLDSLVRRHFKYGSTECDRMAMQRFCGVIDAVNLLNRHGRKFAEPCRLKAKALMVEAYGGIDWPVVRRCGGWKYYTLLRIGLRPAMLILRLIDVFGRH